MLMGGSIATQEIKMLKETGTADTSTLNLLLWRIPYPESSLLLVGIRWGEVQWGGGVSLVRPLVPEQLNICEHRLRLRES